MFWFSRKSTIKLQAFTSSEFIKDNSPITEASKVIPSWFASMPSEYLVDGFIPSSTVKKCPAIVKNITTGLIMPLWADLAIKVENGQYSWHFANDSCGAEIHPSNQWAAYKDPTQYGHLKLISPWKFKTKEDISFIWQQPYLHKLNANIEVMQGIDSYKYFYGTTVNCFLNLQHNYNMLLRHNTPLVQLIPLTEKKVIVENIVVSAEEMKKLNPQHFVFQGRYRKKPKLKCPLHIKKEINHG